jgi:hypothetical protein
MVGRVRRRLVIGEGELVIAITNHPPQIANELNFPFDFDRILLLA